MKIGKVFASFLSLGTCMAASLGTMSSSKDTAPNNSAENASSICVLVDDVIEHVFEYLPYWEAIRLGSCKRFRMLFFKKHRTSFGALIAHLFTGRELIPLDLGVVSMLQIELGTGEFEGALPIITEILWAVYERRLKGPFVEQAVCYIFQQLQLRKFPSHSSLHGQMLSFAFVQIYFISESYELFVLILRHIPSGILNNSDYILKKLHFITSSVAKLFTDDRELFMAHAVDDKTPNELRHVFLRICAKMDYEGVILSQIFGCLEYCDQFMFLLLEADASLLDKTERERIWNRNLKLFNWYAANRLSDYDRFLFYTLNDWKFGAEPFDYSRLWNLVQLEPFEKFVLQLAKTAAESRQFWILERANLTAENFKLSLVEQMAFETNVECKRLVQNCLPFRKFILKHFDRKINDSESSYDEPVIPYYYARFKIKSIKEILKCRRISLEDRCIVAIRHGSSPKALISALHDFTIKASTFAKVFYWLLQFRQQDDEIFNWIFAFLKTAHNKLNIGALFINTSIELDFSPCKLNVVLRLLRHPKTSKILSNPRFSLKYLNVEAVFHGCIRTDIYLNAYKSYPVLLSQFELTDFYRLLGRCDTVAAVGRLVEIIDLMSQSLQYPEQFSFLNQIRGILLTNLRQNVLAFAPALEYWKEVDGADFDIKCPKDWKYDFESYKRLINKKIK